MVRALSFGRCYCASFLAIAGMVGLPGCAAPAWKVGEATTPHARSEGGPSIEQMVAQKRQVAQASYTAEVSDTFPAPAVVHGPPTAAQASRVETVSKAPTIEQTKALGEALAELESQGAIDAATRTQLLDGLKQTDPALWPQLLAYFKTAGTRAQAARAEQSQVPSPAVQLASAQEPMQAQAIAEDKPAPAVTTQSPASKPTVESQPASKESAKESQADAADSAPEKTVKPKRAKPKRTTSSSKVAKTSPSKSKAKPDKEPDAKLSDADWKQQLQASIDKLEKETAQAPGSNDEVGKHAALRMLYLAAGRREDALKPISGIAPAQQDFWSKEIYGLSAFLDCNRNPDASRRAAEANNHLREASVRLGELATLQVRNLAFCTEVTSYGVYKTFESVEFEAGQELLLYAEIENFKSKHEERGYHTSLKASYQILDERGARVDEKEFAVTEEYCQNPRRDFFVRYFVWLPQRIYGGTYTLQLSVEDTLSQKIGQSSLEFKIKGRQSDEQPASK